ncbi:MAG: hypothetical protein HS104_29975 [Polyangiaceae bacterium]|nr:hypothetical protein [Polyangiaceae bacterium]MCE7888471.1 hypothetical protein [Sorangiineae bacterium PRO1]
MRLLVALALLGLTTACGELIGVEDMDYVPPKVIALSALNCTTCAVRGDGSVWCWGANNHGQLGRSATENDGRPVQVELPEPASDVSVGQTHACAATKLGRVYCWGENFGGQTGAPRSSAPNEPFLVPGLENVARVSAGLFHSCALTTDRKLYCWGSNHAGQCGVPRVPAHAGQPDASGMCGFTTKEVADNEGSLILPPTLVSHFTLPVDEVMAQRNTTCARSDRELYCWGSNCGGGADPSHLGNDCSTGGQLAESPGSLCYRAEPTRVNATTQGLVDAFGMGHLSGFAVDLEGHLTAWGWGKEQLGIGEKTNGFVPPTPVVFEGLTSAPAVSAVYRTNGWHQLARVGGAHYSWGENTCGELGYGPEKKALGTAYPSAARASVVPSGVERVTSGQDFTCFSKGGKVFCFGREDYLGQPGVEPAFCGDEVWQGCPEPRLEPVPVELGN